MCSAEQPALKAVCVCLSQPACQTVLIPTEAWLTSSRLAPTPFSPSPLPRASVWSGCPLRQLIGSLNASQILLAPPPPDDLTGSDSNQGPTAVSVFATPLANNSHGALLQINV